MGCFGSRFDKRASAVTSWSSALQFVGGEAHDDNGSPADNFVVAAFNAGAEGAKKEFLEQYPVAEGKATDQAITEAVYTATHGAVTALLAAHEETAKAAGEKKPNVGGFKIDDAITQLKAVLEGFASSAIEIKAAAAAVVADAGAGAEVVPPAENEEGDEVPAPVAEGDNAAVMAPAGPDYSADAYAYAGWEAVPAIFLKQAIVNPYWGNLVKHHIIDWEFNKKAADKTWEGAAGFISAFIASQAGAATEAWFSGHLGEDDIASLKGLAADAPILFPGWISGWKTEAEAKANLAVEGEDKGLHKVIFHVTGATVLEFAAIRLVAHRLHGKVASHADADGTLVLQVAFAAAAETAAKTILEFNTPKVAEPAATTPEPVAGGDPAPVDPPAEVPPAE